MNPIKVVALATATIFGLAACGEQATAPASGPAVSATAQAASANAAGDLRVKLDALLGEHIILAGKATEAALGGRTADFQAYGTLLNTNGTDLGALIGAAYGTDAQNTFNQLWSAHNGFFVDYTTAVAKGDAAGKAAAVNNLTTKYIQPFGAFLAGATGLPQSAVTDLLTMHVTQTAAMVDAQAKGDWTTAYADLRMAYAHMQKIGDALAPAIASKTGKFAGDANTKSVGLRVTLDQMLQEHLYLATMATDAALAGRSAEFAAAGAALNSNGTDIGAAIGGLFGSDAQNRFNAIWSAHNGFFVDYTTAVAKGDAKAKAAAVTNLTTIYVPQFSQFLAGPTGIDVNTLSQVVTMHVTTTAGVVDAQAAKSFPDAANLDRAAGQHMLTIGDALAAGIASKNPSLVQ